LARATEDLPVLALGSRSTPEAAAVRGASLAALKKQLSSDLSAIAFRAVAYSPAQRYQSVEELRDDLVAFLESRPVHARPITMTYRARKFIFRRRYLIAAASALLIVALSGFIATVRQRSIAEERFNEVRRLARYQLFDLYDQAEVIPGTLRLRSSMAAGSLSYLDRLAAQRNLDADLAIEVAEGYRRLGDVQGNFAKATLGNPAEAIRLYQKGLALLKPFQSNEAAGRVRLELEASAAIAAVTSGQGGKSFSDLLGVISRLESAHVARPSDDAAALLLARALTAAFVAGPAQGVAKADTDGRGRKAQEILKSRGSLPQFRLALAEFYRFSAVAMVDLKPSEARVAVENGLKTLDLLPEEVRVSAVVRKARAAFLMTLAAASRAEGDSRRALDEIEKPLSIVRELAADPDDLQACANLALMLENRSLMRWDAEDYQGYVNDLTEALPLAERLVRARAGTRFRMIHLSVLRGLAFGHDKLRSPHREQAVRRAYEALKRAAQDETLGYKPKVDLADMLLNVPLGGSLRPEEALTYAEAAARLQPDAMNCWESIAEANRQLRKYPEALSAIDRALATIEPPKPGEPPAHFHLSLQRKQREIMQQMGRGPALGR
jgi:tetratricopeptide (TPR) repeat protein